MANKQTTYRSFPCARVGVASCARAVKSRINRRTHVGSHPKWRTHFLYCNGDALRLLIHTNDLNCRLAFAWRGLLKCTRFTSMQKPIDVYHGQVFSGTQFAHGYLVTKLLKLKNTFIYTIGIEDEGADEFNYKK